MTQEEQNLQAVEIWMNLFNTDLPRMVSESYTPDCVVQYMGLITVEGKDDFLKVESDVMAVIPDRTFRIDNTYAIGDNVIVEAVLMFTDPNGEKVESPFCAVHTFKDGKIAIDRTYLDFAKIPGL
jgi:limonene-1,2-epoxide hydrolase